MKFALVLLVVLPLAFATEVDKRGVMDFLGLGHLGGIFDFTHLRNLVQDILDTLGNDVNEQKCETTCHQFMSVDQAHLVHTLCTPLCRSFQTVVGLLNLRPQSS